MHIFGKRAVLFLLLIGLLSTMVSPVLADDAAAETAVQDAEAVIETTESTSAEEVNLDNTAAAAAEQTAATAASDYVVEWIKRHEGFTATPLSDGTGTWIGYGSQYKRAVALFGAVYSITEEMAEQLLREDLKANDAYINWFLDGAGVTLNQNQYDALADFTYSLGIGWMTYKNADGSSCLLRQLLEGGPDAWTESAVHAAFEAWCKLGGVVSQPILALRREEADLFLTPVKPEDKAENDPQEEEPADQEGETNHEDPDPVQAGVYDDVPEWEWYAEMVNKATEYGLMQGVGERQFSPNGVITRAQMVMALANLAGADLSVYTCTVFDDVDAGMWYAPAVQWAAEQQYVTGTGASEFQPETEISREQMCVILARYMQANGMPAYLSSGRVEDHEQISEYAVDSVYFCMALDLVKGTGENCFEPQGTATRAQLATVLVRCYECLAQIAENMG